MFFWKKKKASPKADPQPPNKIIPTEKKSKVGLSKSEIEEKDAKVLLHRFHEKSAIKELWFLAHTTLYRNHAKSKVSEINHTLPSGHYLKIFMPKGAVLPSPRCREIVYHINSASTQQQIDAQDSDRDYITIEVPWETLFSEDGLDMKNIFNNRKRVLEQLEQLKSVLIKTNIGLSDKKNSGRVFNYLYELEWDKKKVILRYENWKKKFGKKFVPISIPLIEFKKLQHEIARAIFFIVYSIMEDETVSKTYWSIGIEKLLERSGLADWIEQPDWLFNQNVKDYLRPALDEIMKNHLYKIKIRGKGRNRIIEFHPDKRFDRYNPEYLRE